MYLRVRQVQPCVGDELPIGAESPIADTGHGHRPEHAGQAPLLPGLGVPALDPVLSGHRRQTPLARRPQIQMILQQPPLQLRRPPHRKLILQLGVIKPLDMTACSST